MWLQLLPAHHHVWFVVHLSPLKVRFYASYSSEFVAATPPQVSVLPRNCSRMKYATHGWLIRWSSYKEPHWHAKSTSETANECTDFVAPAITCRRQSKFWKVMNLIPPPFSCCMKKNSPFYENSAHTPLLLKLAGNWLELLNKCGGDDDDV